MSQGKPSDPEKYAEWKRKISEAAKKRLADPEYRERQVARLHAIWNDPERRKQLAENVSASFTAERSEVQSQRMLAHWSDPEARAHHVEATQKAAQRPEWRKTLSENKRKWHASRTPAERQAHLVPALIASQLANPSGLEIKVAALLDKLGVAYETQKEIGPIVVDFYLPNYHMVLECFGCYWHGCKGCGYKGIPGRKRSDRVRTHILKREGYNIDVVWEHEIQADPDGAMRRVLKLLT